MWTSACVRIGAQRVTLLQHQLVLISLAEASVRSGCCMYRASSLTVEARGCITGDDDLIRHFPSLHKLLPEFSCVNYRFYGATAIEF